jgi:hypothetical protein
LAEHFDVNAELWKLANIVTGFAVAQGIAFALALGGDLGRLQSAPLRVKFVLTIVALLFASAYSFAVHRCWTLANPEISMAAVWRGVTYGRHAAIWLFTALGVFGLFAPNLLGK